MNVLVQMKFGSHLYGTSTPASDLDFKGIYIPSRQEIAVGRYPKCIVQNTKSSSSVAKNTAEDVDSEFYSIQYFIELALQGETVALDMLHAPANMLVDSSPWWESLHAHRARFYTRNLNSFVGYARSQAAKYGVKGSRLSAVKGVLDFLKSIPDTHSRLIEHWDQLPAGEHIEKSADPRTPNVQLYTVCGRSVQSTWTIVKTIPIFEKYYEAYGARAKLAADNQAIDWKAISHALRACFQVREILTTGDLKYPLAQAPYLLDVKQGKLDYKSVVGPRIEQEMEELEAIAAASKLPDVADRTFWDSWLYGLYF